MHFEAVKKASTKSVNKFMSNLIDLEVDSGERLLLEDEGVLHHITYDGEADVQKEMEEYQNLLDKFQKDYNDIVNVCEGYETYSMYHYLLKITIKEIVKIPPKLEREDLNQVKINTLKLT
jgi:hypothetical protein